MKLPDGSSGSHGGTYYVYNNTFFENDTAGTTGDIYSPGYPTAVTWTNNIFLAGSSLVYFSPSGGDYTDHSGADNIFYGNGDGVAFLTGNINADPVLLASYTPTVDSPSVSAGTDLSAVFTTDYLGETRTVWDVGAIEYNAGGPVDETPPVVYISTPSQTVQCDSIVITWTDGDNVAVTGRKVRIGSPPDGSNGAAATSPATVTGMAIGVNNIYIGAGDTAGNWGSDSVAITYTGVCQAVSAVGRYSVTGASGAYSPAGASIVAR